MTNSRNKGASFERQIALELELMTGVRFKRDLEQVRAAEHGDLIAEDPQWPFLIECKRYASGNGCAPAWKAQAIKAAAAQGLIPVVIYKFDRLPIRVALPLYALGCGYPDWAEIDIQALAYIAGEMMAEAATRNAMGVAV